MYFIYPDIYFTLAAHNHEFTADTDDTETTLVGGPTPFIATVCFMVQVEVSSLGNVGTQVVSVIKFGSLCSDTLLPQRYAYL